MEIKIITPPDIVFTQDINLLLVCPGEELSESLNKFLINFEKSINIYLFDQSQDDVKWLLTLSKICNYNIVDVDNINEKASHFLSYILSLSNTYYKCSHEKADWGLLNKNKFFDFPNIEDVNERQ